MKNELQTTLVNLLDKYTLEDILFVLYSHLEDRARTEGQNQPELKNQAEALNTACEILDEYNQNETYYLIY